MEYGRFGKRVISRRPVCKTIHTVLTNAVYAGADVYGPRKRGEPAPRGGAIKKTMHDREMKPWQFLIEDNHPGNMGWVGRAFAS